MRADLDGNGFINAIDAKYSRDQQNAIIVPQSVTTPTPKARSVAAETGLVSTDQDASAIVDRSAVHRK